MVEWVDRANAAHVMVLELVVKPAAQHSAALPPIGEVYTEFIISNGLLHGVKQRHGHFSNKMEGKWTEVF